MYVVVTSTGKTKKSKICVVVSIFEAMEINMRFWWIVAICLSTCFEIESRRLGTSMNAALISESSSSSVQVGMGFPSQYYCSGRVFDEPRRYENVERTRFIHFFKILNVSIFIHTYSLRLKCTKNSRRLMNCECADPPANSRLVRCDCDPLLGNADNYEVKTPNLYLLRKNVNESTGFPTDIESPPGRPDGKHSLN